MSELTYEQRFTVLMQTARTEKKAAAAKLETAKAACKRMEDKALAENTLREAERAFEEEDSAADKKLQNAYLDLREEVKAKVQADQLANPDDVDTKALALMESGVLKPKDLAALAERYKKNPTMLRLVAHRGKLFCSAAYGYDKTEKNLLTQIMETCDKYLWAELDAFDRFTTEYTDTLED